MVGSICFSVIDIHNKTLTLKEMLIGFKASIAAGPDSIEGIFPVQSLVFGFPPFVVIQEGDLFDHLAAKNGCIWTIPTLR